MHTKTHTLFQLSLPPSSWEHFKWRSTWMAWRAAMVTARQETHWSWQTFPTHPGVATSMLSWQLCKQHAFLSKRWIHLLGSLTFGVCLAYTRRNNWVKMTLKLFKPVKSIGHQWIKLMNQQQSAMAVHYIPYLSCVRSPWVQQQWKQRSPK